MDVLKASLLLLSHNRLYTGHESQNSHLSEFQPDGKVLVFNLVLGVNEQKHDVVFFYDIK